MKLILFSVTFWIVIATAFSSKNRQYSDKELQDLTEISRQLQKGELAFVNGATNLATGQRCISDFECRYDYRCINVKHVLHDYLVLTDHLNEKDILEKKANIFGKECVRNIYSVMTQYTPKQILDRIKELVGKMNEIFGNDEKGLPHYGLNATDVVTARMDIDALSDPITRLTAKQGYTQDFILPLVLATRGTTSSSLDTTALITLLALSPQGFGQPGTGTGSNPISNPFLLYVLLNDQNTNTNNNNIDLLVLSLALSPDDIGGIRSGSGTYNALSFPLLLYDLLDGSNNFLFWWQYFRDTCQFSRTFGGTSFLGETLEMGNRTEIIEFYYPFYFPFENPTCKCCIESLLPLLLLDSNDNLDNLVYLVLAGGLGGGKSGYGSGGLDSILPLLMLMENNPSGVNSNNTDLLLLLLGGGLGGSSYGSGGINNILPLLLLLGNNTLTGGTSGNSDDTLLYLALFGGLGGGTGTSGTGTGGLPDILPLLLLRDSSGSTDTLTLAILFSQLGQGGFGGGGGPVTYPVYG